jgi:putative transposase
LSSQYSLIRDLSNKHSISTLCETLEVSRSAYYARRNRKPGKRALDDIAIRKEIRASHSAAPCYGVDNIHADVREKLVCGRNRVRRLMREMGISSKRKRKYKATTNSKHSYLVSPDLVKRKIPDAPNKVWVSDITYISTDEGWLYLAIVKDLFSKEVVGWAYGERITTELAIEALHKAIKRHKPPAGLIHHSDRGVQYCSHKYQALLKKHSIQSSMSRKGNPFDNATAENFFSCLKCEMIYLNRFKTRNQAALELFRYIEGFYNRRRRHSALGRISPLQYRRNWEAAHGLVGKNQLKQLWHDGARSPLAAAGQSC